MKPGLSSQGCELLACLLLLLIRPVAAQSLSQDLEPRWLRLDPPEWSVGMETEGVSESVRVNKQESTHDQIFLTPLAGLRTQGSIYHPNLLNFNLSGEGGYSWMNDKVSGPSSSSSRQENGDVLRYLAQVNLLSSKPYNASFTASQDHTYRNYDMFNTYTVDTTFYGGRSGWRTETLTLDADAGYRKEDSTSINGPSLYEQTYVNFSGNQTRPAGQTTLTAHYNEYDTSSGLSPVQSTETYSLGLSDAEFFGSHKQISATTGAGVSEAKYAGQSTETVVGSENILVRHREELESYLNANFSHSDMEASESSSILGEAGVRHRLYESLTSTFDFHGSHDESSGSGSSSANNRYGIGLREGYSKRLGSWGRLTLGVGIIADHEEHEASGAILTSIDEEHRLYLPGTPDYRPVYLNNPRVMTASIQVRGPRGYAQENVDYIIVPAGVLTEIQLVQTSLVLRNGDQIFVSYQSESLYNASFESLNGSAQIRLDIFGRYGVYGRVNWLDNNAPPQAVTQTLTDLVGGVDYTWKYIRAGAEYEDYDSNFIQYRAYRLFETFTWQASDRSTFGLDFSQNFYRYPDNFDQNSYRFVARANTMLTFSLAWYVEGGYALQNVKETDENFGFARTGFTWTRGKLSVRAGYEFNYQTTVTGSSRDERERNHFYAYLKRAF